MSHPECAFPTGAGGRRRRAEELRRGHQATAQGRVCDRQCRAEVESTSAVDHRPDRSSSAVDHLIRPQVCPAHPHVHPGQRRHIPVQPPTTRDRDLGNPWSPLELPPPVLGRAEVGHHAPGRRRADPCPLGAGQRHGVPGQPQHATLGDSGDELATRGQDSHLTPRRDATQPGQCFHRVHAMTLSKPTRPCRRSSTGTARTAVGATTRRTHAGPHTHRARTAVVRWRSSSDFTGRPVKPTASYAATASTTRARWTGSSHTSRVRQSRKPDQASKGTASTIGSRQSLDRASTEKNRPVNVVESASRLE